MKKAKIVLSAVAAVAAIGGAFALKSSKAVGNLRFLYDQDENGICTTAKIGYVASVVAGSQEGYFWGNVTVTIQVSKPCTPKYYRCDL